MSDKRAPRGRLWIRCSEEERLEWKAIAEARGMTVADYIRMCLRHDAELHHALAGMNAQEAAEREAERERIAEFMDELEESKRRPESEPPPRRPVYRLRSREGRPVHPVALMLE